MKSLVAVFHSVKTEIKIFNFHIHDAFHVPLYPNGPFWGLRCSSRHVMRRHSYSSPLHCYLPCVSSVIMDQALYLSILPSCRSSFPKSGHLSLSRASQSPNQSLEPPLARRSAAGGTREPGPSQISRLEPSKQGPSGRQQRPLLWLQPRASSLEPWGAQERG